MNRRVIYRRLVGMVGAGAAVALPSAAAAQDGRTLEQRVMSLETQVRAIQRSQGQTVTPDDSGAVAAGSVMLSMGELPLRTVSNVLLDCDIVPNIQADGAPVDPAIPMVYDYTLVCRG